MPSLPAHRLMIDRTITKEPPRTIKEALLTQRLFVQRTYYTFLAGLAARMSDLLRPKLFGLDHCVYCIQYLVNLSHFFYQLLFSDDERWSYYEHVLV